MKFTDEHLDVKNLRLNDQNDFYYRLVHVRS